MTKNNTNNIVVLVILGVALLGLKSCFGPKQKMNGVETNDESTDVFMIDGVQFQYSAATITPELSWVFVYPIQISDDAVEEYDGEKWNQIEMQDADIKGGPKKVSFIRYGKIQYEKTYDELGITFDPVEENHKMELEKILEKMICENVKSTETETKE